MHQVVEVVLDERVKLFGTLTSIRPTVKDSKKHQLRNIAYSLTKWLRLVLAILFKKNWVEHELSSKCFFILYVRKGPMISETLLNYADFYHIFVLWSYHFLQSTFKLIQRYVSQGQTLFKLCNTRTSRLVINGFIHPAISVHLSFIIAWPC